MNSKLSFALVIYLVRDLWIDGSSKNSDLHHDSVEDEISDQRRNRQITENNAGKSSVNPRGLDGSGMLNCHDFTV